MGMKKKASLVLGAAATAAAVYYSRRHGDDSVVPPIDKVRAGAHGLVRSTRALYTVLFFPSLSITAIYSLKHSPPRPPPFILDNSV